MNSTAGGCEGFSVGNWGLVLELGEFHLGSMSQGRVFQS